MIFLFYGIISLIIIFLIVKYLANINSTKLQSLIKIILGGILLIVSLVLLFRGLYYFSGPLLVLSLWLTRLITFYDFFMTSYYILRSLLLIPGPSRPLLASLGSSWLSPALLGARRSQESHFKICQNVLRSATGPFGLSFVDRSQYPVYRDK